MKKLLISIRTASKNDVPKVKVLEDQCFKYPYPITVFYIFHSMYPELFLVAIDMLKNVIVGYVMGAIRIDGYGHIVSICVHPDYRNCGIGKRLMLEEEFRMKQYFGICRFRLEVRASNVIAQRMYETLGYRIAKVIPHYYSDGEDAYVMVKNRCS